LAFEGLGEAGVSVDVQALFSVAVSAFHPALLGGFLGVFLGVVVFAYAAVLHSAVQVVELFLVVVGSEGFLVAVQVVWGAEDAGAAGAFVGLVLVCFW